LQIRPFLGKRTERLKRRIRADTLCAMSVAVLTAPELSDRLGTEDAPTMIDVRESEELSIASIDGALHMPMEEFEGSIRVLDRHVDYVIICHHGIRSAQAAMVMSEQGFTRVSNLLGGIDAWSCEVDPTVPRY
jgi:rhodanese-related sulfurtransferase